MIVPSSYQGHNTSIADNTTNPTEIARQIRHTDFILREIGSLFPFPVPSNIHSILDIACGPGSWALEVAFAYPELEVIGIDIDRNMVDYARMRARQQRLDNARFYEMDALKPFTFSDHMFDFINARFIASIMPFTAWPSLLQECLRVLKPQGTIIMVEGEQPISNSPALEKLSASYAQALQRSGRSISPDGRSPGITAVLGRFLQEVGYQHIQKSAHVIDFSSYAQAHEDFYQDLMVSYKLIEPFLLQMGIITAEEFDFLYQQTLAEMMSGSFCAINFYLSTWSKKC